MANVDFRVMCLSLAFSFILKCFSVYLKVKVREQNNESSPKNEVADSVPKVTSFSAEVRRSSKASPQFGGLKF